ncbi:hypothetical protein [Cytobacillus spongiae]|nr:hypothetical protein [Cytobacillus spongiae]
MNQAIHKEYFSEFYQHIADVSMANAKINKKPHFIDLMRMPMGS